MRTLLAAILAVPVILSTYLSSSLARVSSRRAQPIVVGAVLLAGIGSFAAIGAVAPTLVGAAATPAPAAEVLGAATFAPVSLGDGRVTAAVLASTTWDRSFDTGTETSPYAGIVVRELTVPPPAPTVVRFRPRAGATGVPGTSAVSVRFTLPMDAATTQKAFTVTVDGKLVTGSYRWAENATVLVMTPTRSFTAGAKVTLAVSVAATSTDGIALAKAASATFRVQPALVATRIPSRSVSGSGSVYLPDVARYYLGLMNCTRTGGWVTSTGACLHPGTRAVKPLWIDSGITKKVSTPYAILLSSRNICSHFADGTPGTRLKRAGYSSYKWAENLGCRSLSNPYKAVLGSHLYFQSEKSYNGGHYVNLMNALYDRVGLSVVVTRGVLRLVVDFYHP